jgi:hypothetical protein
MPKSGNEWEPVDDLENTQNPVNPADKHFYDNIKEIDEISKNKKRAKSFTKKVNDVAGLIRDTEEGNGNDEDLGSPPTKNTNKKLLDVYGRSDAVAFD